jgi:hypothetical protein
VVFDPRRCSRMWPRTAGVLSRRPRINTAWVDMVVYHFRLASRACLFPFPSSFRRPSSFPAPVTLFVVFAARVFC